MHTEIGYKYSYGSCLIITSTLPVCVCSHSFYVFRHKKLWRKTINFFIASPVPCSCSTLRLMLSHGSLLPYPSSVAVSQNNVFNKWCSPQRSLVSGYYWYHALDYWVMVSKLLKLSPFLHNHGEVGWMYFECDIPVPFWTRTLTTVTQCITIELQRPWLFRVWQGFKPLPST